jgi:hypothetical protein
MSDYGYEFPSGTKILATQVELKLPNGEHVVLTGGKGVADTFVWRVGQEFEDILGDSTKLVTKVRETLRLEINMELLRPEDPTEFTTKTEIWTP